MTNKKQPIYFWLKLDNNFYKNLAIKKARKLAGGDTMVVIYQKMMLSSLENNGVLYYEGVLKNLYEELSLLIDEDVEKVEMTVSFFVNCGLIQIDENQNIEMSQVSALVEQETNWARYKREQRKIKKLDNVQNMSNDSPIEKEKEKELEKELEQDTEKDNGKQKAYKKIVGMFENNGFGSVGGIIATNINNELDDFVQDNNYEQASEVLCKAIEIAVNQGKNKPAYVWGITKNWYQKKLFNLSEIEAEMKKNSFNDVYRQPEKKKLKNGGYGTR
ncbi:replisome organizer [Flyfo myovirus Tbat2_7]|nr:replisome organizer [Flyfo myovirus Tbat2_7]